jgi:hypothetical protein
VSRGFTPRWFVQLPIARIAVNMVDNTADPSTIAASMTWPWPLRPASSKAQATPKARNIPPPP